MLSGPPHLLVFDNRQLHRMSKQIMMPPITTDPNARYCPPGPEPNTIGIGPMKTTPPEEKSPCPIEPANIRPNPAMNAKTPSRVSHSRTLQQGSKKIDQYEDNRKNDCQTRPFSVRAKDYGYWPYHHDSSSLDLPIMTSCSAHHRYHQYGETDEDQS